MAVPRATVAYKKKDGIITLTDDRTSLIWSPLPGTGPPVVSLAVDNITNLQQTPDNAPKVMLKVFEKPRTPDAPPVSYLFHFISPTEARPEANAIKDVLSRLLAEARGNDPNVPRAASAEPGAGPSANASGVKPVTIRWFEDAMLKNDVELQQSLLKNDKNLNQIYNNALGSRPESIPPATFNAQFWASRINLLRAHAIELNQKKGSYNVLSTIKPRTENDELKLNLNVEQVQMIFKQHPLVKRIYDENVPKMSEGDFWSSFFLSRLFKKLRGERVTDNDNPKPLFDKYNESDFITGFASRINEQQVPHIIDIEANEENEGGFRSGNRKDVEMRPRNNIPIVRTLNSLSEKIMANVAPSDQDPAAADSLDDATYTHDLVLRDLRGDAETERIVLNVKEQAKFFSNQDATDQQSAEAQQYAQQDPKTVLDLVNLELEVVEEDGASGIDLHKAIGVDDDSDSDREAPNKASHVGSRAARKQAQDQLLESMANKRAETDGLGGDAASPMSIPEDIAQQCAITNATTTEFLKQFWNAFLSGDAARAQELAAHTESLSRSSVRVHALAAEAEKIRARANDKRKTEIKEYYQKTGRKAKYVPLGGGKDAVLAFFEATLTSLKHAQGLYSQRMAAQ
ncbi:hypothetical protein B0T22DRAFT_256938 [Podospora appendiculata]|uniref:BSD domain-containing protein n=1 Tax=Podospora appendiculata TaxID=314037 RepID=A0AAE1C928_9PEZI|nr:hypothetical protein B0T22DRAFT_256938 [Podospora appendiculata]